ncbi:MAG: hypothetical protein ACLT1A_15290 [Dysosmobacter sp.]
MAGARPLRHRPPAARAPTPPPSCYDAISAAKARGVDVVICDTAGRLHNKTNLMNELAKINRVIDRELPGPTRRPCWCWTPSPARTP